MHSFAIPTWHHTFIEIVDYSNIKLNQQLMLLVSLDAISIVYYYRFEFLHAALHREIAKIYIQALLCRVYQNNDIFNSNSFGV